MRNLHLYGNPADGLPVHELTDVEAPQRPQPTLEARA
jgi:hypothetical protein